MLKLVQEIKTDEEKEEKESNHTQTTRYFINSLSFYRVRRRPRKFVEILRWQDGQ